MKPFAFYDFDDTLFKHDSMGILWFYYVKKHPIAWLLGFKLLFLFLLYAFHIISFIKFKEFLIYPLSKMSDEEIHQFYQEALIPRYYPHVVETMKKHHENGVSVWLVSASPEPYLFCTDLPVDKIIGTQVERKNDQWTNHIISKNCKSEEKVRRINEELAKLNLTIDYENSYAYSDSDTDYPMLKLVKHRYRIDKKTSEIKPFVYKKVK